jgi:hypothetical protein
MRRGGGEEHVRYTPETGHVRCKRACPLCANSGHSPQHPDADFSGDGVREKAGRP